MDNGGHTAQYSLRSLFWLTLVVCVLLTTVVLSWDIKRIDAIYPFSLVFVAAPIGIVWGLDRFRVVAPAALSLGSILLFTTSLFVPALPMVPSGLLWGWSAFLYSFVGISMWGEWGADWPRFWSPFAFTMGAATNVAFIVAYIALLAGFNGADSEELVLKSGRYGTILAIGVLVPLIIGGGINGLYPGYGLWVASVLALWLGTRRLASKDIA